MPSLRKRIGFLPRAEVQIIIDQICKNNKLSQSKVTGILVEEALVSRGVLKGSLSNNFTEMINKTINSLFNTNNGIYSENLNEYGNFYIDERNINEEVKMINDYVEFKFFKEIMKKNKK